MPERTAESTHITGLFTGLASVGGVQEASRVSAVAINEIARRRGWSTDFTSLNDASGPQALRVGDRELAFQGFSRRKMAFAKAAVGRARSAMGTRHIIFAGHPNLAPIAVWMQKTSPRARAIVVTHGVEVWKPLPILRRATLRNAFLVVAPSTDTIERLVKIQRVPAERTRTLPWPLSPSFLRFAEAPAALPLPSGFPAGEVVLTVGRAVASEQYKGTDRLIEAFAQIKTDFPTVQLVSIGGGDDLPRLEALAKNLGVTERVHFLRDIPREQIAACYAHAEIFALPSTGEGFGIVFLEAMAFAKPVIAVAAGGARDLVRDEVNGLLVPARDSVALAAALRRLLGDKRLRDSLGRRGASLVRDSYQFDSFRDQVEHILDECALDSRMRG